MKPAQPSPRTDYCYLTQSLEGSCPDDQRKAPRVRLPERSAARAKLLKESRRTFVVEFLLFSLITLVTIVALAACAGSLLELLRATAAT